MEDAQEFFRENPHFFPLIAATSLSTTVTIFFVFVWMRYVMPRSGNSSSQGGRRGNSPGTVEAWGWKPIGTQGQAGVSNDAHLALARRVEALERELNSASDYGGGSNRSQAASFDRDGSERVGSLRVERSSEYERTTNLGGGSPRYNSFNAGSGERVTYSSGGLRHSQSTRY